MPYSDSTKDLIDKLLKDKKVSWRKQREIKHAMSVGSALPSRKLPSHHFFQIFDLDQFSNVSFDGQFVP